MHCNINPMLKCRVCIHVHVGMTKIVDKRPSTRLNQLWKSGISLEDTYLKLVINGVSKEL